MIRAQRITPCLWFDHQAEEAARFYVSIFPNSTILSVTYYGDAGASVSGRPKGSVLTVTFRLAGQEFMGLNGGPEFTFSPAVSFIVDCKTQEDIDGMWEKLSKGGEPGRCGWLTDQYGVSWQIVPSLVAELMQSGDAAKSERAMQALLRMGKLDLDGIVRAAEG